MKVVAVLALLFGVAAISCDPEWKVSAIDGGYRTVAVGLCQGKEGTEPGISCSEPAKCTSYCCQCENGNQYTVAACSSEAGCLDFPTACRLGEAEGCK